MKNSVVYRLLWISSVLTTTVLSFQRSVHRRGRLHSFHSDRNTICFATRLNGNTAVKRKLVVGKEIGHGSYGTVHKITFDNGNEEEEEVFIGKRPWKEAELMKEPEAKDRAARCHYYWEVENHCFSKLPSHPQLPPYFGVQEDWMLFGLVGKDGIPAPTLSDLMKLDVNKPQELKHVGEALGCNSYEETLDKALQSLLTVLQHVHKHQIVHRDIKPSNLLIHDGNILLMDFGSAADLEPIGILKKRKGLENGSRVAVSPVYCAPEVFIDLDNAPTSFDIFSSGLLFCQLLFSYLDERTDAGFHQQLEDTNWDINVWLSSELGSKLRPGGLDHSLEYLGERRGLWTLVEEMLAKRPYNRPTAKQATERLQKILKGEGPEDCPFFTMVIESMDTCPMPVMSQPLHYVATFSRDLPLGLLLSERDEEDDNPEWAEATKFAQDGQVFIKEIIPGGQAAELGDVCQVGDQLVGIGELLFPGGGFEMAVEMLQDQPRNTKNVRLHFDRISVRSNEAIPMVPSEEREINVEDLGTWASKGRRNAQEDAFGELTRNALSHVNSVLLAGVMDGHGGNDASVLVSREMPSRLTKELVVNRRPVSEALKVAWETVCETYTNICLDPEYCRADYDPREGTLMANTGGADLIPGTTVSVMALDETKGKLTVLNCGDSRSLVATAAGKVRFVTQDHTPESEEQRLQEGIDSGLDYSLPQCKLTKWTLSVGAYEYSVARSLEGPFATSKGIVSDADITELPVDAGEILLSATDGVWEVMDSKEVASDLYKMRKAGVPARQAARSICLKALNKGSSDNVSAVVVYL
eukprot:scaffold1648_cov115-Cylindrotheca_fusiformis.AAC.15